MGFSDKRVMVTHGVLARTGRLTAVHDALVAEGEACLAALRAATELGISRIIPETYSKNLVQAITTCDFDQAPGGVIFREIKEMLSLHFNPHRIVFLPVLVISVHTS